MKTKLGEKVPVTRRALHQRLTRFLKKEGWGRRVFAGSRYQGVPEGQVILVHRDNHRFAQLEAIGRELGVLRLWEKLRKS